MFNNFVIKSNSPLIVGKKTLLYNFNKNDITSTHISWLNDKLVTQFSEQRFLNHTRKSCLNYLKSFDNTNNLYLSIKKKDDGIPIGSLSVYYDSNNYIADMGILIGDRNCWNGGFGFDAWFYTMDFLMNNLNLCKISCGTLETNLPMIKLAKKAGMQYDGFRNYHSLFKGKLISILFFAKYL